MKNVICLLIVGLVSWTLVADNALTEPNVSEKYILTYKEIAISEMKRTGIPASIKLAQGLLESGSGQSTLSREANNHFGIKCGGGWTGKTYKHKDDDYVNGKLIKSCFRKFENAYDSYIEHSDFLTTQRRYASLFSLSKQDYYSWAKGLKKAGYATDKAYATKLIDLINKYKLYQYDDVISTRVIAIDEKERTEAPAAEILIAESDTNHSSQTANTSPKTKRSSTSRNKSSRSRKGSSKEMHRVRQGETIASIAHSYGLDPTIVRLRNRIPKDAEPLPGEKIHLRKKFSVFKRPKFTRVASGYVAAQEEFIF